VDPDGGIPFRATSLETLVDSPVYSGGFLNSGTCNPAARTLFAWMAWARSREAAREQFNEELVEAEFHGCWLA
jgi:hypothetical protein